MFLRLTQDDNDDSNKGPDDTAPSASSTSSRMWRGDGHCDGRHRDGRHRDGRLGDFWSFKPKPFHVGQLGESGQLLFDGFDGRLVRKDVCNAPISWCQRAHRLGTDSCA